jgi:hypothetical protein
MEMDPSTIDQRERERERERENGKVFVLHVARLLLTWKKKKIIEDTLFQKKPGELT